MYLRTVMVIVMEVGAGRIFLYHLQCTSMVQGLLPGRLRCHWRRRQVLNYCSEMIIVSFAGSASGGSCPSTARHCLPHYRAPSTPSLGGGLGRRNGEAINSPAYKWRKKFLLRSSMHESNCSPLLVKFSFVGSLSGLLRT